MKKEIIVALILVITVFGCVLINANTKVKIEQMKRDEKLQDRVTYEACLETAYSSYSNTWDSTCTARGLEANCSLPTVNANSYGETLSNDLDRCASVYGK